MAESRPKKLTYETRKLIKAAYSELQIWRYRRESRMNLFGDSPRHKGKS